MTDEQRAAIAELQAKSLPTIQCETARTWALRAWAARKLANVALQNGNQADAYRLSHDATEYEHEAIEHAALCGDDDVLAAVRMIVAG